MPTTSWTTLVQCWEALRKLNSGGFHMGGGEWLIGIDWADGAPPSGPSADRWTACSPCAVQAIVMAFASADQRASFNVERYRTDDAYRQQFRFSTTLPIAFNTGANTNFRLLHHPAPPDEAPDVARRRRALQRQVDHAHEHGFPDLDPVAADGYVDAVVAFGLGVEHPVEEMRRGDCLAISWDDGGGHAAFAWDVHYNHEGRADAVLIVAANGRPPSSGNDGTGLSVYGNPGSLITNSGTAGHPSYSAPDPYFTDSRAVTWVTQGRWVTWLDPTTIDRSAQSWSHTPVTFSSMHAQRIRVARLNGVEGPPSLSTPSGTAPPPDPPPHVESVTPAEVEQPQLSASPTTVATSTRTDAQQATGTATARQLNVERQLRVLFDCHWLTTDPGDIDGINDAHTRDAIREFQRRYMHDPAPDGVVGQHTRPRLRECAHQAANGDPPPDAPTPAAATAGSITRVYWATVSAHANQSARLHVVSSGLDGQTLTVQLKNAADGRQLGADGHLTIADGAGEAVLRLSDFLGETPITDTIQVDALVKASGVEELRSRAPLRVEPPMNVIAPTGKSLFTYWPAAATSRSQEMHTDGMGWVVVEVRGAGDAPEGHPEPLVVSPASSVTSQAHIYQAAGIEVWLWGWPGRPELGHESEAIDDLVRLCTASGARGFIVDVEEEYTHCGDVRRHELFRVLIPRLQRVIADGQLGVGISSYNPTIMEELAMDGAFVSPQWYHPTVYAHDPNTVVTRMRDHLTRYGKIVPTVPVYRDNPHWPTPLTVEALNAFLGRVNAAAALPEMSGKVPAVSAWVWKDPSHRHGDAAALYDAYQQWSFTGT